MKGSWNSTSFILIGLSFFFFCNFNVRDIFAAPTRHLCHPEQMVAILEVKNDLGIHKPCLDRPLKTESWVNSSDCCSWNGITCDAISGDVIELNLSSCCLHDLSQNMLSGNIPQELGHLSYLAYINFSHNHLVGLVPGGTQFQTQPCSSFKDNPGLFGPSLDKACVDIHASTSQQSERPDPKEDEEEVISWIAAAVGFIPGTVFGLMMGYVLMWYKPEWFINPLGRNKRKRRSTCTITN